MDRKRRSASHERDAAATSPGGVRRVPAVVRLEARDLFGDAQEVIIAHGEQEYRLRRTSSGKLILTK